MDIRVEIALPTKKGAWNRVFFVKGQSTKREARERDILKNVSDCCGVELKQRKYCGDGEIVGCGKAVGKVSRKKLVLPGVEPKFIDIAVLTEIEELVADKKMSVTGVMHREDVPVGIGARIVKSWYLYPEKESAKEMANIVSALQASACVFIGVLTVRGSEYEAVFRPVGNGLLVAEMLCEPSQVYATPEFEGVEPNLKAVEVLAAGFKENAVAEHVFDHRDTAMVAFEQAVTEFVTKGVLPQAAKVEVQREAQELEALQEVF
jgi:hypothetical protein